MDDQALILLPSGYTDLPVSTPDSALVTFALFSGKHE